MSKEEVKAWIEKNKSLLIWEGGILFGSIGMVVGMKLRDDLVYGKEKKGEMRISHNDIDQTVSFWHFPKNRFGKVIKHEYNMYRIPAENWKTVVTLIEKHAKSALGESSSEE